MPEITWRFDLDGRPHTVRLYHNTFMGCRTVVLNDTVQYEDEDLVLHNLGATFEFGCERRLCVVRIL